jgi:multidrug efflux pump subunit AcrA (membrane-fusion protein)
VRPSVQVIIIALSTILQIRLAYCRDDQLLFDDRQTTRVTSSSCPILFGTRRRTRRGTVGKRTRRWGKCRLGVLQGCGKDIDQEDTEEVRKLSEEAWCQNLAPRVGRTFGWCTFGDVSFRWWRAGRLPGRQEVSKGDQGVLALTAGGIAVWRRKRISTNRFDSVRGVSQLHDAASRDACQGVLRRQVVFVRCHIHLEFEIQERVLGVLVAASQVAPYEYLVPSHLNPFRHLFHGDIDMSITASGFLTRKRVGYSALALAVAIVAAFAFFSIYRSPSSSSSTVTRTVKVTKGTVQASVSASGNLSTVKTAEENFVSGGTLATLTASVGEKVKAGQVLASVDSTSQSSAVDQATSSLKVAKMNYTDALSAYAIDERTLAKDKSTLAIAKAGGTQVQEDQNQETLDNAEQLLTNDQNQLTAAQTQESNDEVTLANTTATLSSDESLGCPAASTGPGSSGVGSGSVTASSGSDPSVATDSATSISTSSAVLNATVDPNGASTSYYFEYGTTSSYGSTSVPETLTVSNPASNVATQVSTTITGLSADTTYLFTIVATNSVGTSAATGVTLTTAKSSCSVDSAAITTDQAQVNSDGNQVTQDQSSIKVQELAVKVDQANMKVSSSSIESDKSTITQDRSTISQSRVGFVQDQGTIAQDETSLEQDEKSLQETELVALISGTVTAVNGSVGQTVSGGGASTSNSSSSSSSSSSSASSSSSSSALVIIQSIGTFQLVADVAEADAIKIQVHQTVSLTLAALPNTEIRGVVTSASQVSSVVNNVVEYPVTIALERAPKSLKDGMTAEAAIVVQSASNVLLLPSAAVTTTGSVSTVKVLSKGVQKTVVVTLGIVGTSFTQITSGLSEGETVVEPTASVSATTGSGSSGPTGGGFGGGGFGGGAP